MSENTIYNLNSFFGSSSDTIFNLYLLDDDDNTMSFVIDCLVLYANKEISDAESLAWNVHNKGKAVIMTGIKTDLIDLFNLLKYKGLNVSLEES